MAEKSLRDRIRDVEDIKSEVIFVPEWGEHVLIKTLRGMQRAKAIRESTTPDGTFDQEKLQPRIIIAACHDPDTGEPIFNEDDAPWIMDKSAGAIERIAMAVARLSGLDEGAVERAERD